MKKDKKVLVTYGDGIGPEIMAATLEILQAAQAEIDVQVIDIGEKTYLAGHPTGIKPADWEALTTSPVFLKAPITTPQGGGYKSLNVTIRKALGLYANVRPCRSFAPFVPTKHPGMDLVIVRENEEDLYAGIEYQQTSQVVQALKLISRPGCEKIVQFAFEFAIKNNKKKVACFSKDNIMKMADGLFHKVFDEIGAQFPQIAKEHWIVDIGAARLADTPEIFEVIVMENLYGDILSDVAAQIAGSVGMSGSANIGPGCAMFEAIHGSAPQIAGKDIANPSALLNAAILMLVHMGQEKVATNIQNAWLCAIEDGMHTPDIYAPALSKKKVGTREFAQVVIERLGRFPEKLSPVHFASQEVLKQKPAVASSAVVSEPKPLKTFVGVDIYLDDHHSPVDELGKKFDAHAAAFAKLGFKMEKISNRGLTVWPALVKNLNCSDHWRIRFFGLEGKTQFSQVLALMKYLDELKCDIIKIENLYHFGNEKGYTLSQG
jgi:isocitrate dehydrogenase